MGSVAARRTLLTYLALQYSSLALRLVRALDLALFDFDFDFDVLFAFFTDSLLALSVDRRRFLLAST